MFLLLGVYVLTSLSVVQPKVTSSPLLGHEYERIEPNNVDVVATNDGGRFVKVTFDANYNGVQVIWKVDGRIIMNEDVEYGTFRHNQLASIRLPASDINKTIHCTLALKVYHVTLEIRLNGAIGSITIVPFIFYINTPESVTYNEDDSSNLNFDMNITFYFPNVTHLEPKISSAFIAPDYCSRPVMPVEVGIDSRFIKHTHVERNKETLGYSNLMYSEKAAVIAIRDSQIRQGMILFDGRFMYPSSGNDVVSLGEVIITRTVFFKQGVGHYDLIPYGTVTFIDWKHRYEVKQKSDLDVYVYAIGNPTPRVMLERNRVDLSVSIERIDMTSPYSAHTIFRFRNVTEATSGKYVCTVVSGRGRITEMFTVYVKIDKCN